MKKTLTIAINKPKGLTSHAVVAAVRKITGEKKVGHAGTLDPLATGVLVVGVGREATKQLWEDPGDRKGYRATIRLGATSETDDAEGKIEERIGVKKPSKKSIIEVCQMFVGTIQQQPPYFSSVKIGGTPAHRLMRQGRKVKLGKRTVEIYSIELLDYSWPLVKLAVETGSGTYIRSLARDLGEALGTGGYLAELTRTYVGDFFLADAISLEEFEEKWKKGSETNENR